MESINDFIANFIISILNLIIEKIILRVAILKKSFFHGGIHFQQLSMC